jgi:DNA mismatch repair protein MutL
MSRVQRLPDDLVNKIQAGEVVERPASVVKELAENALDAGARSVHVEIEDGGTTLIRVRDDGHGMGRADAELALERHATSKLRALADLQQLSTHGFRGEALPSIAAVSELVLRTRSEGETAGTEVEVAHGKRRHVRDVGHPRGTTVEVRDLFGTLPARRKFLRAAATEASHVAEAVTLLALARPEVGFSLRSSGRTVVETPPVDGLAARIFQIFGAKLLADLAPVEGGADWVSVRGFVSRPDRPRPPRPSLRLFVNRRAVRDRALSKAVLEAYRKTGAGERGFEAFLFVELAPHLVDINVHPAKTEVRFADARTVFAAVERTVREGLSEGVREAPAAVVAASRAGSAGSDDVAARAEAATAAFLARPAGPVARPLWGHAATGASLAAEHALLPERPAPDEENVPVVLGQHRLVYIVATDGEELVLVDQHTAHERVRFEELQDRASRRLLGSQGLLAPLVVGVEPRLVPVLEASLEGLRGLGFDVEPFGAGTLRLRAVPAVLGTRDPGPAFTAILQDLAERDASDWAVADARDRIAATLACHSAVRAGQPLGSEVMSKVVRDLFKTSHRTLCPHGRPTMVRVPKDELSRWFGRTGWRRQ